jgi:hypothetical protein
LPDAFLSSFLSVTADHTMLSRYIPRNCHILTGVPNLGGVVGS